MQHFVRMVIAVITGPTTPLKGDGVSEREGQEDRHDVTRILG
jgi:hypothetical protein